MLASCSVEEPKPPLADKAKGKQEAADSREIPVTTFATGTPENAGLRADFNAP